MITIKKLTKKYKDRRVLDNISVSFPRNGLIAICGDSGCGKTTFLNCLSCLLDYEGDIIIDGVNLSKLSEEEGDIYRLKHIGFIFQDFKLFNSETAERNILLPLEMSSDMKDKYKQRKVEDLLEIVGLTKLKNQKINLLSGGERQRIAIARALVNDPKIILADEPTGALDSVNAEGIMKILEGISKKSLVLVVSHDEDLMRKYASKIIHMKDGKISSNEYPNREDRDVYLPIFKNKETNKKPSIPVSFLLRHSLMSMKEKKWRTIICNLITSLGLIGVGLAVSLSSTISANIKKAYSSMIDDSKIVMSVKGNNQKIVKSSGSYYEAMEIAKEFPEYVLDVGVNYQVDFESFFKDKNEFALASTTYRQVIEGMSARHINEFKWLDFYNPKIYPKQIIDLKDDEIIFAMNFPMIQDLCLKLRIERSVNSLSDYLANNEVLIYLDVANNSWQYRDQQIFTLKGFVLENTPGIYHSNHLWNEYMFEDRMRFPTNDNISHIDYYPWVMKKSYYFHTNGKTDDFLIKAENSKSLDEFILDISNTNDYPWLYKNVDVEDRHRVSFYLNTSKSIPKRYADILIDENKDISSPIYGNNGGYVFYPSNMLSGFAHQTFFSFSQSKLETVIDDNSTLNLETNEYIVLREGVMVGHFSKTLQESVRFAPISDNLLIGTTPNTLDEIVISTGLAKELNGSLDVIGHSLFLGYNDVEMILEDGTLKRTYIDKRLIVTGLIENDKFEIYHEPYWTVNYFKSRLGVSAFDTLITSVAFNSTDKSNSKTINKMSKAFPDYEIVNPMENVNGSVNQICSYIEIALSVFSIVATLVASLLLTMCTYLHVLDSQKEIALSRCLGVSKKESKKFVIYHAFVSCLISLIIACVEIIVISIVCSYVVANALHSETVISFDITGILLMVAIAFVITLVSSLWVSHKVAKINPLSVLKN